MATNPPLRCTPATLPVALLLITPAVLSAAGSPIRPVELSAVRVDDTGIGACRLPASWRLLYREGGGWKPVASPSGYGCEGDRYNRCEFTPVTTGALRLEVKRQEKWAGGIHEWRVEPAGERAAGGR